jgi:hypothetical protein
MEAYDSSYTQLYKECWKKIQDFYVGNLFLLKYDRVNGEGFYSIFSLVEMCSEFTDHLEKEYINLKELIEDLNEYKKNHPYYKNNSNEEDLMSLLNYLYNTLLKVVLDISL